MMEKGQSLKTYIRRRQSHPPNTRKLLMFFAALGKAGVEDTSDKLAPAKHTTVKTYFKLNNLYDYPLFGLN